MTEFTMKKIVGGTAQCSYCHNWDGKHWENCPHDDPEAIEVWQSGFDAAKSKDDCYAPAGSVFHLGWAAGIASLSRI